VADTRSRTGTKLNIILGHPNAVANSKAGSEEAYALEMAKCRPAGPFYRVGLLVGCLQEMHGQAGPLGRMSCGFEPTVRKAM
jgi:hypothetical protein